MKGILSTLSISSHLKIEIELMRMDMDVTDTCVPNCRFISFRLPTFVRVFESAEKLDLHSIRILSAEHVPIENAFRAGILIRRHCFAVKITMNGQTVDWVLIQ